MTELFCMWLCGLNQELTIISPLFWCLINLSQTCMISRGWIPLQFLWSWHLWEFESKGWTVQSIFIQFNKTLLTGFILSVFYWAWNYSEITVTADGDNYSYYRHHTSSLRVHVPGVGVCIIYEAERACLLYIYKSKIIKCIIKSINISFEKKIKNSFPWVSFDFHALIMR